MVTYFQRWKRDSYLQPCLGDKPRIKHCLMGTINPTIKLTHLPLYRVLLPFHVSWFQECVIKPRYHPFLHLQQVSQEDHLIWLHCEHQIVKILLVLSPGSWGNWISTFHWTEMNGFDLDWLSDETKIACTTRINKCVFTEYIWRDHLSMMINENEN